MNGIKINSLQMGSYYDYINANRLELDLGEAVLDYSLFTEFLFTKGLYVKEEKTLDFIMCKIDYGSSILSTKELRDYYYENGFSIDWNGYLDIARPLKRNIIKYKVLCRTTGKAKEGDFLAINSNLFDDADSYLSMGIKLTDDNPKIVELSAYKTLTMAHMETSISLPLDNILILKDQKSYTKVNAVIVDTQPTVVNVGIDFNAMEKQANDKGFTFRKTRENRYTGLNYIDDVRIENLNSLFGEDNIIKKENVNKKTGVKTLILDKDAMEVMANKINLTFSKKLANKIDGFTLLDRDTISATDNSIDVIYKTETVEQTFVKRLEVKQEVFNTMWDGCGILDSSKMPKSCKEFVYLRNHMTKVCMFEGEVIQFLKDEYGDRYYTDTITDKFGVKNIRDIKAIMTDSAIKWEKFDNVTYEDYQDFLAQFNYKFAVVKTAHKSKYTKFGLQRGSFQGWNSLPCSDITDLTDIAKESIDYTNNLKTDTNNFIEHLIINSNRYSINNVLVDLYKHNKNIFNSDWAIAQRSSIISKFKRERLMLGKLLQKAENCTVVFNPYGLLMYAINEDWSKDPTLNVIEEGIQVYTKRFPEGELMGYRSPHNSPNNIAYYNNFYHPLMAKYFPNFGDNVIAINCIETDSQMRKNGEDADSDFEYISNSSTLCKYSKICVNNYPTIINNIKSIGELSEEEKLKYVDKIIKYDTTPKSYSDMDYKISLYQFGIGEASNLAQLALSYYHDELAKTGVKNIELENAFCTLSVLAQLFIDSSKKTYILDLNKELDRIRNLDCMNRLQGEKYPWFYAQIQNMKNKYKEKESRDKKEQKEKKLAEIKMNTMSNCECPMDILSKIIDKGIISLSGKDNPDKISIRYFLVDDIDESNIKEKQWKGVIKILESYDCEIQKLDKTDKEYSVKANMIVDKYITKLKKRTINRETMYKLIRIAFALDKYNKINSNMCVRILTMLYNLDNNTFINSFKKST